MTLRCRIHRISESDGPQFRACSFWWKTTIYRSI